MNLFHISFGSKETPDHTHSRSLSFLGERLHDDVLFETVAVLLACLSDGVYHFTFGVEHIELNMVMRATQYGEAWLAADELASIDHIYSFSRQRA